MDLTPRQNSALLRVVEEYLASGEAVGSVRLRDLLDGAFSSATLRNDLLDLCEAGFLEQSHVSAGRSPTDKGLRYFVDTLPLAHSEPEHERWLEDLVHRFEGSLNLFLEALCDGLAKMSGLLTVTAVQTTEAAPLEHVDLSFVNQREVMLVAAIAGGQSLCTRLRLDMPVDSSLVRRVSERLREKLTDSTLALWTQSEVAALIESIALDERRLLRLCLTKMKDLISNGQAQHQVAVAGIPNLMKQLPPDEVALLTEHLVPEILRQLSKGAPTQSQVLIGSEMGMDILRPFATIRTLADPTRGVRCTTLLIGPRRSNFHELQSIAALGARWAGVV